MTHDIHDFDMENIIQKTPVIKQNNVSLWQTDIFGFVDDFDGSLEICLCHVCSISKQYNMLKYKKNEINYALCISLVLFPQLIYIPTIIKIRGIIQKKYNIDDTNLLIDLLYVTILPMCTVCQHYREMSIQNEWTGGTLIDKQYKLPSII